MAALKSPVVAEKANLTGAQTGQRALARERLGRSHAAKGITSEQVLSAAARLFRARGYASTTTRELASELGLQKASLYHHITNKEDLLYGLSRQSLEHMQSEASSSLMGVAEPMERIRVIIKTHLKTVLSDQDKHATMLTELKELSPEHRREIVALRNAYQGQITELIRVGQQDGHLRSDIDARTLSLALLNLMNWTIFWYSPSGQQTPDEIGESFAKIFLEGALATTRESDRRSTLSRGDADLRSVP
jgi:AcrR family transcriptional regulator